MKRVDLLGKVEIDDGAVVEPEGATEGVEGDLQAAVEIPPVRRLEKIDEVDAEERVGQCSLESPAESCAARAQGRDELDDIAVECLRGCAEHPAPADADILIVDSGWQRQDDAKCRCRVGAGCGGALRSISRERGARQSTDCIASQGKCPASDARRACPAAMLAVMIARAER